MGNNWVDDLLDSALQTTDDLGLHDQADPKQTAEAIKNIEHCFLLLHAAVVAGQNGDERKSEECLAKMKAIAERLPE